MKIEKAPPGAKRLIESLRNLGYECSTAIADLIDNSLSADATEIDVDMNAAGETPAHVLIADNGKGMDRSELSEAMRYGALQEYSTEDLGKYGLGLKTASLSQCGKLTVGSKPESKRGTKPRRTVKRWDLHHVFKVNDWDLMTLEIEELKDWERRCLDHETASEHGTVVLWTELEESLALLSTEDPRRRERFLAFLIEEVSAHLSMVFHRFMQGSVHGRRRVKIRVCGQELSAWDPFCRDEKTRELGILRSSVSVDENQEDSAKDKITLSPFILPKENEFSTAEVWKKAAGPKGWNFQQGFYFYRNNRLLQAGGWSNLRAPDEHTKLLRVAVDFPGGLDKACALNVTKMRARIPAEVREEVKNSVSRWAKTARERYDKASRNGGTSSKPSPSAGQSRSNTLASVNVGAVTLSVSNAQGHSITISKGGRPGALRLVIPHSHDCAEVFKSSVAGNSNKSLCFTLFGLLEAIVEKRLDPRKVPLESLRKLLRRL